METSLSTAGNLPEKTRIRAPLALSGQDFKLLKVFKAVVEAGGFSAAQNELNVGLAAISKQISDLEIRIGMRLCSRGREGFSLTEEGQLVYQASIELFNSVDNFRDRISCAQNELVGELGIGTIDNTIGDQDSPLIGAIQRISTDHPKVRVRLSVAQLDEVERGVVEGRFIAGIVPVYQRREEFDYFELYQERSALYCGAGHELFAVAESDIQLERLRDYNFVQHRYAMHTAKWKFFDPENNSTSATQVEAVAILLLTGNFIGFLPCQYAAPLVQAGRLRGIRADAVGLETSFCLILRHNTPRSPLVKVFAQAMGVDLRQPG
ncbi:LysR family transcriptional regulator [Pseudomonas entomophila]|uniref:LysR family transcriptional regulator n=1 Tax=Pseudomonas entomophila TaxID=312306 RepID=UPI0023D7FBA4|nr:LysR family transcriptional regulator [Pseudomonas entomophila]MDF0729464.1 LysR family transcriptional regulator [Pseudomonas entomophila]